MDSTFPAARRDLVVKHVDKEVLIYDERTKQAFCLNETSAVIWELCDGKTSIADLTAKAQLQLAESIDESFVNFALAQLQKDGLLEGNYKAAPTVTRAQLLGRLGRTGVAAAIALPVITGIMAPTAAKAYGTTKSGGGNDGGWNWNWWFWPW